MQVKVYLYAIGSEFLFIYCLRIFNYEWLLKKPIWLLGDAIMGN